MAKKKRSPVVPPETLPEMTPGMRQGETPPFWKIGEYLFQDLCRDLYFHEEGVRNCDHFGIRGQAQFGADLVAHLNDYESADIVQCKAFEKVKKDDIKKACDKFLENLHEWKDYKIKRFIIMFACPLDETQFHKEIKDQKPKFLPHSIHFEVWSASTLQSKLSKHPEIVGRYCTPPEHWLKQICGLFGNIPSSSIEVTTSTTTNVLVNTAIISQLEAVTKSLSETTGKNLEIHISRWKEGKLNETMQWLKDVKDNNWKHLSNELQARILRLEASILLDSDKSLEEVEALANEARKICPEADDSRMRALISYYKGDIDNAIGILQKPTNIDNANMLSSLYLSHGSVDKSFEILFSAEFEKHHNSESFRVLALAYLIQGKIDLAESYSQKSLNLSPEWRGLKFVYACIQYYKSISPSALPKRFVGWPESVELALVKSGSQSMESLKNAHKIFSELVEKEEDEEAKYRYQTWIAACLLNLGSELEAATNLLSNLVDKKTASFFAVSWILTRNVSVDLDSCTHRLLSIQEKDSSQIITLAMLYLQSGKANDSISLLESSRSIFEKEGFLENWLYWLSQAYINAGNTEKALELIDNQTGFKFDVLRFLAYKKNDKQQGKSEKRALSFARKQYKQFNSPFWLLELSTILHFEKKWKELSNIGEELVEKFKTIQSLQLCLVSLFNVGEYQKCLDILEKYENIFVKDKLPENLSQIKVLSLRRTGKFPVAIREAETLVKEYPTTKNFINIFQLCLEKGDSVKLRYYGEELAKRRDTSDREKLSLAQNLLALDRDLSKDVFLSINLGKISDQDVSTALTLSYKLGIEDISDLHKRMNRLGTKNKHGVRLFKTSELKKFIKESSERADRINSLYRTAQIPIHMAAPALNVSLPDVYHSGAILNEELESSRFWRPLLYSHGGRNTEVQKQDLSSFSVILDVTSFLNAEHFDYLKDLENGFKTIQIPQGLPIYLSQVKDNYIHHQQSRVAAIDIILDLVHEKKVLVSDVFKVADAEIKPYGESLTHSLKWADANNGLICEFYPPSAGLDEAIEKDDLTQIESKLVDFKSLAEFALAKGLISKKEYDFAISKLPKEVERKISEGSFRDGQRLLLPGNIPEVIAAAGLLKSLSGFFSIYIEKSEFERIQEEKKQVQRSSENKTWVDRIHKRISDGVDSGKIEFFAHPDPTPTKNLEAVMLEGLVSRKSKGNELLVSDDRMMNSYQRVDQTSILDSYDLLRLLQVSSCITSEIFYSLVLRMRSSGIMFIKPDHAETIFYLRQASTSNTEIIETKELSVLRKYYSGMLLKLKFCYQKPGSFPNMPNPLGEGPLLVKISQMAHELVLLIWDDSSIDTERKILESNWVMENLYISFPGVHHIGGNDIGDENLPANLSVSLSSLLTKAIQLDAGKNRKEYLTWAYKYISDKTEKSPQLFELTCQSLKRLFVDTSNKDEVDSDTITIMFYRFLKDLPKKIRKKIEEDTDFMQSIGLKMNHFVNFADFHFLSEHFWFAIEKVLNGESASLSDSKKRNEFEIRQDDNKGVIFKHKKDNREFPIYFPEFDFLKKDADIDSLFVPNDWFDTFQTEVARVKVEFTSLSLPHDKANLIQRWMKNGLGSFYNDLNKKIKNGKSVDISELIPSEAVFLLKSYRLQEDSGSLLEDILAGSVDDLLETDFEAAFLHYISLPVAMPENLVKKVNDFDEKTRRDFFKRILRFAGSPITKAQIAKILLKIPNDNFLQRIGLKMLRNIVTEKSLQDSRAFLALQRWVYGELQNLKMRKDYHFLISWAHTSNLFSILVANNVDLNWVEGHFSSMSRLSGLEIFRESNLYKDCLHPHSINSETFLYKLFSYSFGGDFELLSKFKSVDDSFSIFFSDSEKKVLKPSIMLLQKEFSNITSSFLGPNYLAEFAEIFPPETNFFTGNKFLEELLVELETKDLTVHNVLYFSLFMDSLFSSDQLKDKSKQVLDGLSLLNLFEGNPHSVLYSIVNISEYAFRTQNDVIAEIIWSKFKKLFEDGGVFSNAQFVDNIERLVSSLLEIMLYSSLAVEPESPKSFEKFADRINDIGSKSPRVYREVKYIVERIVSQATAVEERYLWDLVLVTRSC